MAAVQGTWCWQGTERKENERDWRERERIDRDTGKDRGTDRDRDKYTQTETEKQRDRETETWGASEEFRQWKEAGIGTEGKKNENRD
jgi:hypothetical protein